MYTKYNYCYTVNNTAPNNEQKKILVGKNCVLKLDYNLEYHSPK